MKRIVEKIVQLRNPIFQFDSNLNDLALIQCLDSVLEFSQRLKTTIVI